MTNVIYVYINVLIVITSIVFSSLAHYSQMLHRPSELNRSGQKFIRPVYAIIVRTTKIGAWGGI